MMNRNLLAFGIQPIVAYVLSILVFMVFSEMVFVKTDYAFLLYPLLGVFCVSQLSSTDRTKFLKSTFLLREFYKIRVTENFIIASPFLLWLVFKVEWLSVLALTISTILATFLNLRSRTNFTIPTPFGKNPFEHSVGFRVYFLLILLTYFVSIMGIIVDNFNLNIFGLSFVFIICILFYNKQEEKYMVWMNADSPASFLFKKIKFAILHSLLLALPLLIALWVVYPESIGIVMLIVILGLLNVVNMMLATYSAYPLELSLPQGILLIASFFFPPFLLFTTSYFYGKAKRKLVPILG